MSWTVDIGLFLKIFPFMNSSTYKCQYRFMSFCSTQCIIISSTINMYIKIILANESPLILAPVYTWQFLYIFQHVFFFLTLLLCKMFQLHLIFVYIIPWVNHFFSELWFHVVEYDIENKIYILFTDTGLSLSLGSFKRQKENIEEST